MEFAGSIRHVNLVNGEIEINLMKSRNWIKLDIFIGCKKFRLRKNFQEFVLKMISEKKGKFIASGYLYNSHTLIADRIEFQNYTLEKDINNFISHVRKESKSVGLKHENKI